MRRRTDEPNHSDKDDIGKCSFDSQVIRSQPTVFLTLDFHGDLSAIVLPLLPRALDPILDFKWPVFYTD
jgi:hypothetical protein